jgi:DNA-binding MarR family transcriptional regulator
MKRNELLSRLEHSLMIIGKGMHEDDHGHSKSSPAQNHVLMVLCMKGDMGVKQLAEALYVTSGAVTQHVDALEKAGFVVRKMNANNRRQVIVKITEKGQTAFQEFRQAKTEMLSKVFGKLDDDELHALVGLIEKVSQQYVKTKGDKHGKI